MLRRPLGHACVVAACALLVVGGVLLATLLEFGGVSRSQSIEIELEDRKPCFREARAGWWAVVADDLGDAAWRPLRERGPFHRAAGVQRELVDRITRADYRVHEGERASRVLASEVLVCCDTHNSEVSVKVHGRLVDLLRRADGAAAVRTTVLVEFLPSALNGELARLGQRAAEPGTLQAIDGLLRSHWPWPVRSRASLLHRLLRAGWNVEGIGVGGDEGSVQPGVEDSERAPSASAESWEKWDADFNRQSALAVTRALEVLRHPGGPSRVLIIVGAAHALEPDEGVQTKLLSAGVRSATVLNGIVPIDQAFLRSEEGPPITCWLEVAPGFAFGPLVREADWR